MLANAPHLCSKRLDLAPAGILAHTAKARRAPFRLRLAHGRLGCVCPIHRFSCERRWLPKLLLTVFLLFQRGGLASRLVTPARRHQQRRVKPLRRSPQPPTRSGRERRRRPSLGLRGADVLSQHSLLLVAIIVVDGQRAVHVDVLDNTWEPVPPTPEAGFHALADVELDRGRGGSCRIGCHCGLLVVGFGLGVDLGGRRLLWRRGTLGGGKARRASRQVGARGRLLGGDEAAEGGILAGAPHPRVVASAVPNDSIVARRTCASAWLQREPFRRRLRHRLFGRERRRLGIGQLRLRLGRPSIGQGRLLCGGEVAELHRLAGAIHACVERLDQSLTAAILAHAAVARRVARWLQRQPLRLGLAHGRLGCACQLHPIERRGGCGCYRKG
eukprot:scaffold61869_cov65-Phaeocystis_antarctica.AAC.4